MALHVGYVGFRRACLQIQLCIERLQLRLAGDSCVMLRFRQPAIP